MSAPPRRYKQKRRKGLNLLIWIIVLAIFSGGIVFFVSNYYESTKTKLEETSYPRKYGDIVEKAAAEYDLEPALIFAVIRTESGFEPEAELLREPAELCR